MASPSSTSLILGPDSEEKLLLEFRAGKMILEATTVKPDLRKGFIRVMRGQGFLRVQWRDRSQEFPEDDILVFPFEANFVKVQQSGGRVYLLKFKHDDRKHFFWMQEPNEKQDLGICTTVDYFLNCHSQESDEEEEEQVEIAEPSPETPQILESSKVEGERDHSLELGAAAFAPSSSTTSTSQAQGGVQLEDLQRILRSITPLAGTTSTGELISHDSGPSLADVLKPELVMPLLEESHVDERLTEFLPEGCWTTQAIGELMQSPQFHQQVDAFTHVLRSGQIDLTQFGIDASKYNYTVLSFLEAIEDQVAKKSANLVSTSEETLLHAVNDVNQGSKDHEGDHHMEDGPR
ncbi:hypothetical protein GOP47_0016386 [Adiantum capillus-veneris]|uniref:Regulatory particle non-ATPase 13 n=1 Tax=Adiantum capillus-veneris TaxID=13818 RepID=A0A9D4UIL9_ADICA|nr:hypothetical protein GOP47_0016386 [Adiantum capillus-veneris]